jgi:hypothetical protein
VAAVVGFEGTNWGTTDRGSEIVARLPAAHHSAFAGAWWGRERIVPLPAYLIVFEAAPAIDRRALSALEKVRKCGAEAVLGGCRAELSMKRDASAAAASKRIFRGAVKYANIFSATPFCSRAEEEQDRASQQTLEKLNHEQ